MRANLYLEEPDARIGLVWDCAGLGGGNALTYSALSVVANNLAIFARLTPA